MYVVGQGLWNALPVFDKCNTCGYIVEQYPLNIKRWITGYSGLHDNGDLCSIQGQQSNAEWGSD